MKTEKKVLLGFSFLGIFIAFIAFFLAKPENENLVEINQHHNKSLSLIQNIQSKSMEAIEESFAYVISGERIEKEEFLEWNKSFPGKLIEFVNFDSSLGFHSEEEKENINKILSHHKDLVKWAGRMFLEYERAGKVTSETFLKYESSVDQISKSIEILIKLSLKEVNEINLFVNEEIRSNKEKIYVLGTLTLIFCLIFGYFLYIHIQGEEFKKFENERLLDSLSRNTKSVMYLKGLDGRYLFINKRYEDLFHLKNENVKGKTDLDLFPKEVADNFIKNDRKVMKTGLPFEDEEVVPQDDGVHTYISIKVPLKDSNGMIYGMCGISTDITERKNAEKELEAFASIASHDLQAPLRKISIFGDRLKESAVNLDDKSREYIERMQKSAQQMSLFIEDILNLSIISEEKIPFEKIDLQEQLHDISEELNHIVLSSKGKIEFSDLPEIEGNKSQINQLIINLIVNAFKYKGEDKTPFVKISARKKENNFVEITVEDNGIGFDEKYSDKIFEPFQRLHGGGKYSGTGLGLTICKKIVSRHQGHISVKSIPGEGTTFFIVLPEKQNKFI